MTKDSIRLEGLVLHSPEAKLELSRQFYQALLNAQFTVEQHDASPQHYFYQLGKVFLELYPSPEKKISSFALDFSTPDIGGVLNRMQDSSFQPKTVHGEGKIITFLDPEDRNIRVHSVESSSVPIKLDEAVLHTHHPSEARSFYQQLLETTFTEQSYGAGQVPFYSGMNNDIALKLWPDNVHVSPSPRLSFACSDLDMIKVRMEKYSHDWKPLSEGKARLLDPDKRKIILSEQ